MDKKRKILLYVFTLINIIGLMFGIICLILGLQVLTDVYIVENHLSMTICSVIEALLGFIIALMSAENIEGAAKTLRGERE